MRPAPIPFLLPILLAMTLAACVTENRPATCDEAATTIRVTVEATSMEPSDPAACQGQEVTLVVDAEVDGILHVHGLDTLIPATSITAGEELTLEFTPDNTGQFPIELHLADNPQGVAIGIFTVYDR